MYTNQEQSHFFHPIVLCFNKFTHTGIISQKYFQIWWCADWRSDARHAKVRLFWPELDGQVDVQEDAQAWKMLVPGHVSNTPMMKFPHERSQERTVVLLGDVSVAKTIPDVSIIPNHGAEYLRLLDRSLHKCASENPVAVRINGVLEFAGRHWEKREIWCYMLLLAKNAASNIAHTTEH